MGFRVDAGLFAGLPSSETLQVQLRTHCVRNSVQQDCRRRQAQLAPFLFSAARKIAMDKTDMNAYNNNIPPRAGGGRGVSPIWKKYAYLILLTYLIIGFFYYPALGLVALICMLAPVVMAVARGREWCGNYCPRGSLWDEVFARLNPSRTIPAWAQDKRFRYGVLVLIFGLFTWQMVDAWPSIDAIGGVFLRIIFITTLIGVFLALVFSPRTWCSFCPMGTLASLLSKGKNPIHVAATCVSCGLCAKACPMDLNPYRSGPLFADPDCIKCGVCVAKCPKKALSL